MRPRYNLAVVTEILVIIVAVVAVWFFQPKTTTYNIDFEEDFNGWIDDADVSARASRSSSIRKSSQFSRTISLTCLPKTLAICARA